MKVEINNRGNGACPLCIYHETCIIHASIKEAMDEYNRKQEMELVIYTCPRFKEKA